MKFNKLDVPYQWKDEFTKYPHGYTIFEALCSWTKQVDKMVDNINDWNDYLDNFVEKFDSELQEEVQSTITKWQNEGLLDVIIESALNTELDNVKTNLNGREINAMFPPAPLVGAKFDGSDDSGALNSIINYISDKGGGTLILPPGNCMIASPVTVRKNCYIKGSGKNVTTVYWDENDTYSFQRMIEFEENDPNSYSGISNLTLNQKRFERGLKDQQNSGVIGPKRNVKIDNVRIHNTVGPGIDRAGVENVQITNCEIFDTGHHCIYFSTGGMGVKNVTVENCVLSTPSYIPGRNMGANIFKIRHSFSNDVVENIKFKNNRIGIGRDEDAIDISTTNGEELCLIKDVLIENIIYNYNKEFDVPTKKFFYLGSNSKVENLAIVNNVITGHGNDYAIRVLNENSDYQSVKIVNNRIEGFNNGIEARYSLIEDNTILFGSLGIVSCTDSQILNNNLFSTNDNACALYRNTNSDIVNNKINLTGLDTLAMELNDSDSKHITGNTIIKAVEGIKRRGSQTLTNCIINENVFIDCNNQYPNIINNPDTIKNNVVEHVIKDRSGASSNRPEPKFIGERYFDTTLNKPLWWSGTDWVDANGTTV